MRWGAKAKMTCLFWRVIRRILICVCIQSHQAHESSLPQSFSFGFIWNTHTHCGNFNKAKSKISPESVYISKLFPDHWNVTSCRVVDKTCKLIPPLCNHFRSSFDVGFRLFDAHSSQPFWSTSLENRAHERSEKKARGTQIMSKHHCHLQTLDSGTNCAWYTAGNTRAASWLMYANDDFWIMRSLRFDWKRRCLSCTQNALNVASVRSLCQISVA